MSEQVGINQGDHIYYYDLSTGGITREWFFQGGSPTGGTAHSPDVRYYGVNYTGYSTTLVVTGAGGITAAATKSNVIVVYPELFNPYIEITSGLGEIDDSPMGKPLTYSISGTASSGYSNYAWNIPQLGATSGSLLSSVNYTTTDWYTLTGTYIGAPNSSYLATSLCNVTSVAGNQAALSSNINFRKIGIEESVNYWSPGTYATSGKYYDTSVLTLRTSSIGLGGNSLIFKIDFNPYTPKWNNLIFHSTQEAVYLWPNSPDVLRTYAPVKTNIILTGSSLVSASVTGSYISKPRIMTGNYIIPGDILTNFDNRFYIADNSSGGLFTSLFDGLRKWSAGAINDFINNKYYLSGSSKFIELGGFVKSYVGESLVRIPSADLASGIGYWQGYLGYAWDGGWAIEDGSDPPSYYHGVSIPSGALLEEKYGASEVDVDIRLILRDSAGSVIDDFEFIVSSFGSIGNTPDVYMISASDSGFGNVSGIATLINNGIIARGGGLSNNIIFEANAELCSYTYVQGLHTYDDGYYFGGLKMSIKDPRTSSTYSNRYIHSLEIMWGSQMSDFMYEVIINDGQFPTVPLASDINASGAAMASWTGLPSKITVPSSSYVNYFRGWKIGGSL